MTRPIRVLILVGPGLYREALHVFFTRQAGIEIVGDLPRGTQAVRVIDGLRPNVILLDVGTPGSVGIELIWSYVESPTTSVQEAARRVPD